MSKLREIRKNPFNSIGIILSVTCFILILILFAINIFIGDIAGITTILLYYVIPLLLIMALILLTINKIRETKIKQSRRNASGKRRSHGEHHNSPS